MRRYRVLMAHEVTGESVEDVVAKIKTWMPLGWLREVKELVEEP